MTAYASTTQSPIRRPLLTALAAGLCVAALAAIVAITGGGFDDGVWRVISIALGFTVFSATAAAGAMLLQRGWESVHALGWTTIGLSALSFITLVILVFSEGDGQLWGCSALATFAASHASIVTRDARDGDGPTILALCWTSIASAVILAGVGITGVLGGLEDAADGLWQMLAVLVIVWLLTFALPPILRRMDGGPAPAQGAAREPVASVAAPAAEPMQASLLAVADRLEDLQRTYPIAELGQESERLRELARRAA